MSLVDAGLHYIRDGVGNEQIYDLETDPIERHDLMKSTMGQERVEVLRGRLLKLLNQSPGSAEVEHAYLDVFRRRLKEDVERPAPTQVAVRP